jgi:hypothetical protein
VTKKLNAERAEKRREEKRREEKRKQIPHCGQQKALPPFGMTMFGAGAKKYGRTEKPATSFGMAAVEAGAKMVGAGARLG